MPTPPLDSEVCEEVVRRLRVHLDAGLPLWSRGGGTPSAAAAAARDAFADGWVDTPATFQGRVRSAVRQGFLGEFVVPGQPLPPGLEVHETGVRIGADGRVQSRSIKARQSAGPAFAMPPGHRVKGVSALVDGEGRERARWIKTGSAEEAFDPEAFAAGLRAALQEREPAPPIVPPQEAAASGKHNLIPYFDAHIGGKSWAPETGENYDLAIAERVIDETSAAIHAALPVARSATVLWGGDNMHARDDTWETPANRHRLQGDSRIFKVGHVTLRAIRRTVKRALATHQHVDVVILRGNHDEESARMVGLAVMVAFEDDPRVTVHVPAGNFWGKRYGRNLIFANHGDAGKLERLPLQVAVEMPDDWAAATAARHIVLGHQHRAKLEDIQSVWCMVMPPICARDAYAASLGLHSVRGVKALTYDLEAGYDGETFRRIHYGATKAEHVAA